ncbi:uncharacterized protein ZBIST_3690 [Zygosaccharomyces bailii]|nr:uncharacterized protein ZBIST_3690 [Zygosaccharomyces bailii]
MSDKRIPRPRNAFILFRQHNHRLLIEEWTTQGVDIPHNSKISKILGSRWKALSDEERGHWEQLARKEKCEHEKKYPDYRYKPVRRHKRRGSRPDTILHDNETQRTSHVVQVPAPASGAVPRRPAPPLLAHPTVASPGSAAAAAAAATLTGASPSFPTFSGTPQPYHHPYYVPVQSYLPRLTSAVPSAVPPPPPRPLGMLPSVYTPMPSAPISSAVLPSVSSTPGPGWQWQRRYCYPFDQRGHR